MGKSRRQELHSRLTVLIWHLLKWRHQPEKRSVSWDLTIDEQRRAIEYVLEESPSLRPTVPKVIVKVYSHALRGASKETGLPVDAFPAQCPFNADQILDKDYLPE